MPYPRLLNLDDTVKTSLVSYLREKIFNIRSERGRYLENLKEMQKIYWAEPKEGKNKFPFTNASKLVIPLSAIAIETIHAKDMTSMFGMDEIVHCKAELPEYVHIENTFGTWFNKELKNNAKIKQFAKDTDLERVKYGNCVGRASYIYEEKTAVKENEQGEEEEFTVVTKNGAIAHAVSLSRFIMPFIDLDPQDASIVGEEFDKSEHEVRLLEESGYFYKGTVDKIKAFFTTPNVSGQTGASFRRAQEDLEKKTPSPMSYNLEWYRLELEFKTDSLENSKPKAIIVDFHYDSGIIMAVRYNWYYDLRRSYRIGHYFPIEHRWTGVGVCKQLMEFQKEITVQHRQRIDNATLANTRMIKISKLSGYGPNEPIFPGKMWFLDEMDHIDVMQMGDVYNSAFNNEQTALMYAQQRSGIDELSMGQQQVGTPGTATDVLSRVQEGRGKSGYFFENFRDFMSEIILDVACNVQQFGPHDIEIVNRNPNGQIIKSVLSLPEADIRQGLAFTLSVVGQNQNKLADRQNLVQLSQMLQQYWEAQLALAQQVGNPQLLGMIVLRAMTSSTEVMRQISESFEMRNTPQIVLPEEVQNALEQLIKSGGTGGSQNPQQNARVLGGGQIMPPNIAPVSGGVS
jgi:hypothetical protein